jgi:thioredoxin:protein disulfide reductase
LFLLLGLGLAFTPCVLPMVPILSSIIVGDKASTSRWRGLLLSIVYALGMAIVYTTLGVAAGLAGEGLAAALQNPWMLGGFAFLIAVLSLSMFGLFQLQMPAAIQEKLMQASEQQSAGKFAGVFMMGALSALIVGPCVAAPLAGTLMFISRTRDVLVGGSALFAMAAGMSIPLLLVGASAGALLPRSGAWMDGIKRFFGVLMLATALWMISPVIPGALQMAAWAVLGVGYAAYLFRPGSGWPSKALAVVFACLGLLQLVGVATGGRDVLAPLAQLGHQSSHRAPEFARVKSVAELDSILAKARGKTVMLDFYADWCVSCKEMEKLTFTDARIQSEFADMLLLQADVTANNADEKTLLKRFGLFGPPGIIFFGKNGREITGGRVIGYQDSEKFLRSLSLAKQM